MIRNSLVFGIFFCLFGCGANEPPASESNIQASIKVSTVSVNSGDGNTVSMFGNSLPLSGANLVQGDQFPAITLTGLDMKPVELGKQDGRVKIISIVPSLDTKVCEVQTHHLSERSQAIEGKVDMITVSMDLPFAQKRFSDEAKITNVQFLSDYKEADFGTSTGLLIAPTRLLARALIVVDQNNIIQHLQVVDELTSLPDLAKAREVAASLL